jgi:hypothetical protein
MRGDDGLHWSSRAPRDKGEVVARRSVRETGL